MQRVNSHAAASARTDSAAQPPRRPAPKNNADVIHKTNQRLGYKNNWHRRQVDLNKAFNFLQPLPLQPRVAIIGGGLAGLVCAQELARRGIRATVFDTGEHGVGGRLATRQTADNSIKNSPIPGMDLVFDHAAQYFVATDARFSKLVEEWEAEGAVKKWSGPVGSLRNGRFVPLPDPPTRYAGAKGMRGLADWLADSACKKYPNLLQVVRPMWVGRMQGVTTRTGEQKWDLQGVGRSQGLFDAVVIAHNGKCANRLVGNAGAPRVAQQLMALQLSAVWAVMVAFKQPVKVPGGLEGAFVQGDPVLAWAANNSAKLGLRTDGLHGCSCWTLISTKQYGKRNKVPQEAVPAEVAQKIVKELLQAFEKALGLQPGELPPAVYSRAQLWGAALPLNTPGVECIFDASTRVGVCGDWLLGGSMQAAAISGLALAEKIAELQHSNVGVEQQEKYSVGLDTPFSPLNATDIGEFPGTNSSQPGKQPRAQQQSRAPAMAAGAAK